MKHSFLTIALAALALAVPASADSKIKIDTVPAEYTPYQSILHEPVHLGRYYFEVNEETGRARVIATYTYDDNMTAGEEDGGGPQWTIAQIPGLTYDAQNRSVVYDADGKRTICAVVQDSKGFWGRHSSIKSTGACTVSTAPANLTVDDGWSLHHRQVLDTYFEVH